MSLEETRGLARQLKNSLDGTYRILPPFAAPGHPVLPENMLEISDLTMHLAVIHYSFEKLAELLQRFPTGATKRVRALIVAGMEASLENGKASGGNRIIGWDPEVWNYREL